MKTRPPACLIAVVSVSGIFFGCRGHERQSEQLVQAPPRVIDALPEGHFKKGSGLSAYDLEHGGGPHRIVLRRDWGGADALNTRFGRGWSDANDIRLTLIDSATALLWRGGLGWRVAHSNGGEFRTSNDDQLLKNGSTWTFQERGGNTLTFDESGRLTSSKSGEVTFNYEYDTKGRLTKLGSDSENFLRYTYDTAGRVAQVDGPEGLRATYRYDEQGRLAEVTNDLGIKIAYRYDERGGLLSARDQFGREKKIESRIAAASPGVKTEATGDKPKLDENGQPDNVQAREEKRNVEQDSAGYVTSSATQSQITYRYDRFGRITEAIDPSRGVTRFAYNKFDLPTLIAPPGRAPEKLSYNALGMLVRWERSHGEWREFSHDTNGRIVRLRSGPFGAEEHLTYDERDDVLSRKMQDGKEVTYTYDANGRLLTETWSSGEKIMCRYNGEGQLAEVTGGSGLRTEFIYRNGELIEASDPVHGRTRLTRENGTLAVEREGLGKATQTVTVWGKPLTYTATGGRKMSIRYDDRGLPITTVLHDGVPWRYGYDAHGALESIASPGGVNISLKRDALGRISEILRGDMVWRQFRYNDAGQVAEEFSPLGSVARFERNEQGQLVALTQPDGRLTVSYSRDGSRRTVKAKDLGFEEQFAPDGSLATRNYTPARLELRLPRDKRGRPAGIELDKLKAAYQFDDRGQLTRIDLPRGESINVIRDEAGRVTKLAMSRAAILNLTYDRANRITSLEAANAAGTSIFREAYQFDEAGNLSEIQADGGVQHFEYDALGHLRKISGGKNPREFRYDVDGNLWWNGTSHAVLEGLGRPAEQGATRYTWDFGGNLGRIDNSAQPVENKFDAANRLTQRSCQGQVFTYSYLPGGDRLWKQSNQGKRWFAYTEDSLAGIRDESATTWLLVNMPGTDWPLALCGSNGKTLFVIADRLNSTRRFVDESGNVIAARDFDAFGKIVMQSGEAPLGLFAGMLDDGDDFYYARQRYYEASIARFISIDPLIGTFHNPASHNAYAYAANNPLRYRDPHGTGFTDEIQDGNLYGHLTAEEQATAVRAYQEAERARRVLANPARSAADVATANRHLVDCEAVLEELNRRARVRYKAALLAGPTEELSEVGKRAAAENLAEARRAAAELGEAPTVALARFEERAGGGTIKLGVSSGTEASASTTGRINVAAAESAQVSTQRIAEIERAFANNEAVVLTEAESELLLRSGRAGAREAAAEVAGQAGKTAAAAGETIAKSAGIGGRLLKALRPLLPWFTAAGLVSDMYLSYETGSEFTLMTEAAAEANDASAIAKAMATQLGERLAKLAAEDSKKLLPMPDGKPFDPNNPEHVDHLMTQLHSNLTKNRKPFEGIIDTEPDPEQQAQLDAAVAAARKLIAQGHEFEREASAASTLAIQKENQAQEEMQAALKIAGVRAIAEADLAELPTAAENVKKGTAAAQEEAQRLQAAEGELTAAVAGTEAAATRTCEFAQQAPNATEEQVTTWQNEASSLLFESSNQLNAAQDKIERTDVAADDLQRTIAVLQGYKTGQDLLQFADKLKANVSEAKAAQAEATKARGEVTKALAMLRGIPAQVTSILAPVSWSPLVVSVQAEADALGANIEEPGLFGLGTLVETALPVIDAFLSNLNRVEQMITSTNIDALVAAAQTALESANNTRARVRSVAAKPERYAALQRASQCLAAIQFTSKSVAEKSPSPSPSPSPLALAQAEDEITVPNLGVFDSAEEMKAVLAHAGLTVSLVAAQDAPPSKEKEFKYASQSPPADTKVKRGSAVTVAFYPRFDDATAGGSNKIIVPDMSVFDNIEEMKAVLRHAGLKTQVISSKEPPPTKAQEFKFAAQSPPAGTEVDRDTIVYLVFYGEFAGAGTVPNVVGLSFDAARSRLHDAGLNVGGVEAGTKKPPSPEQASLIYEQTPTGGQPIPSDKLVSIKMYGSTKETASATPSPSPSGGASATPTAPPGTATGVAATGLLGYWDGEITVSGEPTRPNGVCFVQLGDQVVPKNWINNGALQPGCTVESTPTSVSVTVVRNDLGPGSEYTNKWRFWLQGDTLMGANTETYKTPGGASVIKRDFSGRKTGDCSL